jgi:BirA family biotin operon repressor/biotin-[acetyl-CoA-carboxylase] ligase
MECSEIRQALQHLPIPAIHFFHETNSTNQQALDNLAEGAPDYALFITEKQSMGRGRLNRRWITTPGASLAFSLILHPTSEEGQNPAIFSLVSALAVCRAVESLYGVHPQIKWPNDVLLAGKKWCGILVESVWLAERSLGLVAGIGINLTTASVPPDDEVLFPATCLADHVAGDIHALQFLARILEELINLRPEMLTRQVHNEYKSYLAYQGKQVALTETGGQTIHGVLEGVDRNGHLILRNRDGGMMTFPVGDLQLRPKKS